MKLIEALKAQKKTNDKIERNLKLLEKYSSKLSTQKPYFDSDEEQRNEVQKLIEANISFVNHFLWLKRCIEYTNVKVVVEILGQKYTIADLLNLKRSAITMILKTYEALNDSNSLDSLRFEKKDRESTIDRFYDEKKKNESIKYYRELLDSIDSKLEIVNATTDLIDINEANEKNIPSVETTLNDSGVIL